MSRTLIRGDIDDVAGLGLGLGADADEGNGREDDEGRKNGGDLDEHFGLGGEEEAVVLVGGKEREKKRKKWDGGVGLDLLSMLTFHCSLGRNRELSLSVEGLLPMSKHV